MKVIYIAGPYTAPTREEIQCNINIAEIAGKQVLLDGNVPLIPHRISAHWDDDPVFNPETWDHTAWLQKFCLPLLERCDAILLLPGWTKSKGTMIEFNHALAMGKEIYYHPISS